MRISDWSSDVCSSDLFRRIAAAVRRDIGDIARKHAERIVVAGRIDRLWQIDDDRPGGTQQHVEFGQIAVDQPGTQHAHDLADQELMPLTRLVRSRLDVIERSEEHTSELQSLMSISYAVFCLK